MSAAFNTASPPCAIFACCRISPALAPGTSAALKQISWRLKAVAPFCDLSVAYPRDGKLVARTARCHLHR